jgi:hypothetical protein
MTASYRPARALCSARLVLVVLALAVLSGCAAVALTAGGLAAGSGINHTLNGISYKTFNNPMDELRGATLATLAQMDMAVELDEETEDGWEISATAIDRIIEIELEQLTSQATRMRVVTHEGEIFFKDSATSTEIIIITAENLAG